MWIARQSIFFNFAVMGDELVRAIENIDRPKIGLLNIGEEEIKGIEQVKQAFKLLSHSHLNFIGYVEGDHLCTGEVDVVVTDGFAGNVALKATEGVGENDQPFAQTSVCKKAY